MLPVSRGCSSIACYRKGDDNNTYGVYLERLQSL